MTLIADVKRLQQEVETVKRRMPMEPPAEVRLPDAHPAVSANLVSEPPAEVRLPDAPPAVSANMVSGVTSGSSAEALGAGTWQQLPELGAEVQRPALFPETLAPSSSSADPLHVEADLTEHGVKLGITTNHADGHALEIVRIVGDGAVDMWNKAHPGQGVTVGDMIIAIHGVQGDFDALYAELAKRQAHILTIVKQAG